MERWACGTLASGGTVTSVGTGSGLTGRPITITGMINLAATNLLPTVACGTNQIPKWNGGAWTCSNDNNSGGTVVSVTAGSGLTGGTIVTSGTLAVDPTSTTFTGNFFKQGGNAFGVDTAVLGTTDGSSLQFTAGNVGAFLIQPDPVSPIITAGSNANNISAGASGAVISGGGSPVPVTLGQGISVCDGLCINRVTDAFGTIGGGLSSSARLETGVAVWRPVMGLSP